jgi:DNA-binding IclR family transcriptional regulator
VTSAQARADITATARSMGGLAGNQGGVFVAVVSSDDLQAVRAEFKKVIDREARDAVVGLAGPATGLHAVAELFADARRCTALLQALGRHGELATPADLSFYRFLFAEASNENLATFVEKTIGVLMAYDNEHTADLVRTLAAFLDCGRHHAETSRSLNIHHNTLHQRLRRIDEVIGAELVAILDVVEWAPMGSSELARHLGLSVPTTHRLAAAMVTHGLLRRGSDGRLRPGQRFESSSLVAAAGPVLEDLRRETGETAQLWVRRADQRLCLVSAESESELRAFVPVGSFLPLSARASAARVLVAGDDPLDPAHPGRRWFESVSQRTRGLGSVSAPVRLSGEVAAAVCVSAPLSRLQPAGPGAQFGDLVVAAAERIEELLRTR